ncbi:MAG: hypothetical protein QF724_01860 [Planctomycetota bacterium]|nr:hypothetical protein [Planctomycetota bacterium]MDP6955957.1 hypothetical protein [Planctomycetota bacterium]
MTSATPVPKHFWIVGIIALLWNGMGAFGFVMTQTKNEKYLANFTPEQLEFFYGFPWLIVAAWAAATWGSLLASVLLLRRRALAVRYFTLSLACMAATAIHNFGFADGASIMGTAGIVFTAVIFLISLGLVLYSKALARADVLT